MCRAKQKLYHGEPACNFDRESPRPEYSVYQIDNWAEKYLEETKQCLLWAENEEDPKKKKEIYNMSLGLYKLLEIYFGYYGEEFKNIVERSISCFWYDLRDESVIINQVWIAIKSSIIQYDSKKKMAFGSFLHMNIKKRIRESIKLLKNKAGDYQIPTSCLSTVDESGDYREFEFEDIRNNYSILEVKEQVEYLMKLSNDKRVNHEKQKFILNFLLCDQVFQYSQAEKKAYEKQKPNSQKQPKIKYNKKFPVKQLAEILSEKFGGSVRSNINYIYCFQKRMEKVLSDKRLNTTYPKTLKELKDRNRRKFFNKQSYEKNKAYEEYLDKFKKGLVGERYII